MLADIRRGSKWCIPYVVGTHQAPGVEQITDEMVVTGFLMVQGQSVMVKVVA